MHIKTAVTLGTGAAVGFLFGLCVCQSKKEEIVSGMKDKIVYALTGEHIQKKRYSGKNCNYHTTYAEYYKDKCCQDKKEETKPSFDWKCLRKDLFEFDSFEEADEMMGLMTKKIQNYGVLSIHEAAYMRNLQPRDFTWDKYGWTEEDLEKTNIVGMINGKWLINIASPRILK